MLSDDSFRLPINIEKIHYDNSTTKGYDIIVKELQFLLDS